MQKKHMNAKTLATAIILGITAAAGITARAQEIYSNPVLKSNCPDPTVIDDRARSGYFYLYSTQTAPESIMNKNAKPMDQSAKIVNLPVYKSKDLVNWEFVGDGFPDGKPSWVKGAALWAPDINYINGQYVLYYALGVWGGVVESASGVAVSDSPEGPFIDKGKLVDFKTMGTLNSIDPNFFDDGDRKFLYWGSLGGGIYGIELSRDGLSIAEGAKKVLLGAKNMEGAYMYKRNGWYYLFASAGTCCNGINSTYHIVVGRSESPLGPFVGPDKQQLKNLGYKYTLMAGSLDKTFVGPGHNAEIITDDNGNEWMLYHSYNAASSYRERALNLDQIHWTQKGWPYFETGEPSDAHMAPVFLKPVEKEEPTVRIVIPLEEPGEAVTKENFFKKTANKVSDFFKTTFTRKPKAEPVDPEEIRPTEVKQEEIKPEKDLTTITAKTEPVKVAKEKPVTMVVEPDQETHPMVGAYGNQRPVTEKELELFRKMTSSSAMKFTPISVATQVVAGTNYKYLCKCEDAAGISSTLCEIVIYEPLNGNPEVTDMRVLKDVKE